MDELQTIREALEDYKVNKDWHLGEVALAALSRLEARAAEWPDMTKIIGQIDESIHYDKTFPSLECWKTKEDTVSIIIGQYAYRYSEDIRKDRDEWKKLSMDFLDIIQGKLKGDKK